MNYFNEIKVVAPLVVEDLEKTIKALTEKKEYFENAPKPEKKSKKADENKEAKTEDKEKQE